MEDVLEFLLVFPECGELPPLYCLPKYKRQNQLVMDKVQDDLAEEVKFTLYSLPVLL